MEVIDTKLENRKNRGRWVFHWMSPLKRRLARATELIFALVIFFSAVSMLQNVPFIDEPASSFACLADLNLVYHEPTTSEREFAS
jgi:hypothetical protein